LSISFFLLSFSLLWFSVLAIIDVFKMRVPNTLTYPFVVLCLCFAVVFDPLNLVAGVMGLIIGFLLWNYGFVGGADAKVLMGLSALLGIVNSVIILTVSVVLLGLLAYKNKKRDVPRIPFLPVVWFVLIFYNIYNIIVLNFYIIA